MVIDHGDKVGVVLLGLGLAWWTVGAILDPNIQPSVSATQVRERIGQVDEALRLRKEPNFREFEDVRQNIEDRLSVEAPPVELITGITDHLDITAQAGDILVVLSGYVIGQPILSLQNRVGSMTLDIVMPAGSHGNEERVQDGMTAEWRREILGKEHVNSVQVQGLFIELAVGEEVSEESWRPLNVGSVQNGVLLMSEQQTSVRVDQLEQWANYHFRASILVSATSPAAGERAALGREVFVFNKSIPWSMIGLPPGEQLTNGRFEQLVEQANQGRDVGLAAPAPRGFRPIAGQVGFRGLTSQVVSARALSDTTVALMRVSPDVPPGAQPGPGVELVPFARIAVNKRLVGRADIEWSGAQEGKYTIGQRVGGVVDIVGPDGRKFPANLETPWKVVEVRPDVERTLYHEVRLVSQVDDQGQNQRVFQLRQKTRLVNVVVLENLVSGSRVELTELLRQITVPRGTNRWISPAFEVGQRFEEQQAFRDNPVDFRDPPLVPTPPMLHGDMGLISRLISDPLVLRTVSLPYVEMPEGYLLYYDKLNRVVERRELPPQLRNIVGADMLIENKAAKAAEAAIPGPEAAQE
jgi:hypothetical protein